MKKLCLCALLTDEITQNDLDRWRLPPMASKVIGKETISDGSSFAFAFWVLGCSVNANKNKKR